MVGYTEFQPQVLSHVGAGAPQRPALCRINTGSFQPGLRGCIRLFRVGIGMNE